VGDQTTLFADGRHELDRREGPLGVGSQQSQQLEAACETRLVVGSQDRRSIGADDAVVSDEGHDAAVGAGGVHVR
jgi:hypothetical protein